MWQESPDFSDVNVQASTTYSCDTASTWHDVNSSPYPFSAVTPPAGSIDNHKIGLDPTGSYWGGMGEQIEYAPSGNLNFSYPLVTAQGRGWSVPLSLSYNAQNWRLDNYTWNLNQNTAAGYGWNLQFGSLEAFWSNSTTVHYYQYTDATGATYRLDHNNNGIWSSAQSVYVWYDSTVNTLRFRDGSFWLMDCISYSTELDAGKMYPHAYGEFRRQPNPRRLRRCGGRGVHELQQ